MAVHVLEINQSKGKVIFTAVEMNGKLAKVRRVGWLLLILLTAVSLRLYDLAHIPPGLTHDEADHGITAWRVVNGVREIYFTIGYGREPFYDYSTAVLMSFLGPTYLAGRLTAVFFGLLLLAGMTVWVRRAYDNQTALLTAAGLAVGFWAVMTSRQALRSITLPALFVFAVCFFWLGLERSADRTWQTKRSETSRSPDFRSPLFRFMLAGLVLGITFYSYMPARILWLIFPALLGYVALVNRPLWRRVWQGTTLTLLVAAVLALPLFYYLVTNPTAETRIQELSRPLMAAAAGNLAPLWQNTRASLRLFTIEGDGAWRYNIPGRPFLLPVMGVLFYAGVGVASWQALRPLVTSNRAASRRALASFLALAWLVAGMAPVFVTGPELSVTRAIGMQPVLYLFPALALVALSELTVGQGRLYQSRLALWLALLLFAVTAVMTARDYFVTWANAPQVRVQYETTMVTAMHYLNENGAGAVAVSTNTPARYHSPAVAQMTLHNEAVHLRWFDARHSLLLPQGESSTVIIPGFTPLSPALAGYFESAVLAKSLELRQTDLDRPLDIYRVDSPALSAEWQSQFEEDVGDAIALPVNFGNAAEFLGYDLQTSSVTPGAQVTVATLWRVQRPVSDVRLFTHLLGSDGKPIAQADRLDVPGHAWRAGDLFIQLHQFQLPQSTAVGQYPLTVGLYTPADGRRLPVFVDGESNGDILHLNPLVVTQ